MKQMNVSIKLAKEVFELEAKAVKNLSKLVDEKHFAQVVKLILNGKGKLIFSGVGKAGLIAQKVSSTFSSLGNSAFFMHSADASHGDLGMVDKRDIVFFFSNSGETKEVISIVPLVKKIGCSTIGITGNKSSFLYQNVDHPLYVGNEREACGLNLAPTTSTTVMLAMGDALAVSSLKQRNFDEKNFAFYHPGGSLGKKLMQVKDLMRAKKEIVSVALTQKVKEVIFLMTQARIGTAVVTDKKKVVGVFSDGDLRRNLEKDDLLNLPIKSVMTKKPFSIQNDAYVEVAIDLMTKHQIGELPVVDHQNHLVGVACLKDLV